MDDRNITSKDFFWGLNVIHLVFLVGSLIFLLAILVKKDFQIEWRPEVLLKDFFFAPVLIVSAAAVFLSRILFKKRIGEVLNLKELTPKVAEYRTASIIKFAILEGAVLFTLFGFNHSMNIVFLLLALFYMLIFYFQRASKEHFLSEFHLTTEERNTIEDPDGIVARMDK